MKKVHWITETAVMLALLIALQAFTAPLGQLVTGSCVNAVLAVTVLLSGIGSGLTVALLSPVFAYLLGIAPQLVAIPAIMAGNAVFVWLLHLLTGDGKSLRKRIVAWLAAAVAKFLTLYVLMVQVVCGLASGALLERGLLKAPMLEKLPAMFTWPQLLTALIGGGLAMLIFPLLKKVLKR